MPKVRYTYRVVGEGGYTFTEEDILSPNVRDISLKAKQMVMVWNETAEKTGDPEREFVDAVIIDAFIHLHEWHVTITARFSGGRDYLACNNCKATAFRNTNGRVSLDPKFDTNHFEFCHEEKRKIKPPSFK